MAHTLQERYSSLVLAKIRQELVLKDGVIFNNDYEGSPKAGAVKIPVRDTEVAVSDYDKANGITAGTGGTAYETMTIDKDKVADGMSLYAIDEDIEELMGVDEESIEARNAKEAIAYEEGFSTDDVTLDEDIYWDELLDKLAGHDRPELYARADVVSQQGLSVPA